jgi:peptidoglycan hydrolase-like protein with peptidoglycan-binding domain
MLRTEGLSGVSDIFSDIFNSITGLWQQFFGSGLPWGTSNQEIVSILIREGNLMYGSQGNLVKALQIALCLLGYYPCANGWIDGIFGEKTRKAVLQFQSDYNITVDGVVGPETIGKLKEALISKGLLDDFINQVIAQGILSLPSPTPYPYPYPAPTPQPVVPVPQPTPVIPPSISSVLKPLLIAGGVGLGIYLLFGREKKTKAGQKA